jgi:hypothetical protein
MDLTKNLAWNTYFIFLMQTYAEFGIWLIARALFKTGHLDFLMYETDFTYANIKLSILFVVTMLMMSKYRGKREFGKLTRGELGALLLVAQFYLISIVWPGLDWYLSASGRPLPQ